MANDLMVPISRQITLPNGKSASILTSFDPSTPEGRKRLFGVMNGEFISANDVLDTPLAVVDVIVYPDELPDRTTKEVIPVQRTVLICEDGTMVTTTSGGVVKSVLQYCGFVSPPPWSPPALFAIKETRTKDGRPYRYLSIPDLEP